MKVSDGTSSLYQVDLIDTFVGNHGLSVDPYLNFPVRGRDYGVWEV